MLESYWSLGRDIVRQEAESRWGSGFFNQLSLDMKAMFPNETGFSVTNLKYMKRWYVFYTEDAMTIKGNQLLEKGKARPKYKTFKIDEHISFGTPDEYDVAVSDERLAQLN